MRTGDADATDDGRWRRVLARDRTADGVFWYSVASTGVFCRPSCPSRAANPRHVAFHDSVAAAVAAGYRPCRRCRPDEPSPDPAAPSIVRTLCRLVERDGAAAALARVSAQSGRSPARLGRLFRDATGLTPSRYAAAARAARAREAVAAEDTVTDAIYASGFGSSGRFYENADRMLGMTPTRFRAGGASEAIRYAVGASSLGAVLVASTDRGIAAILLGDDGDALVRELAERFPHAALVGDDRAFAATVSAVVALAERPGAAFDLPLDLRGTAFQRRVWDALRRIPAGTTLSYSALAAAIGAPHAVRAVASACGANPAALAVPCHRVVRRDGALGGYAWGLARKRVLLEREKDGR